MAVPSARNSGLLRISKCTLRWAQLRRSTCRQATWLWSGVWLWRGMAVSHSSGGRQWKGRDSTTDLTANTHTQWCSRLPPFQWPLLSSPALCSSPPQFCSLWILKRSCGLRPPSTSGLLPCQHQHRWSWWACLRCRVDAITRSVEPPVIGCCSWCLTAQSMGGCTMRCTSLSSDGAAGRQ